MNINSGDLVTVGSTADTNIVILKRNSDYTTYNITVVSGTLKVGEGSISANAYAYPADSKIQISMPNGMLWVKAGSGSDTFSITAN